MTNKNTMSKFSYVIDHILWAIAVFVWYNALCFTSISGLTMSHSKTVLLIIVGGCLLSGIILTFKYRRNNLSLVINIIIPFEIYALLTLGDLFTARAVIVLSVAAVLCAVFVLLVMSRPLRRGADKRLVRKSRIKHAFLGARTISAVCVLAFIMPVAVNSIMGNGLYMSDIEASPHTETTSEWTIENQLDTLKLLEDENWEQMSVKEKTDALAVFKNIEMNYLGIKHEVYLRTDELEHSTLANYSESEYTITIDVEHLRNSPSDEVLQSLCHECYHVYQFQQVYVLNSVPDEYKDMLMFSNAKKYEYEFANYKEANSDGYSAYASQAVEQNADEYGDRAVERYLYLLEQYESEDY